MDWGFKDSVALVTGATRGIGKGIAIELASEGASVYFTGRSTDEDPMRPGTLAATTAEIEAVGGRGIGIRCDHHVDADVTAPWALNDTICDSKSDFKIILPPTTATTLSITTPSSCAFKPKETVNRTPTKIINLIFIIFVVINFNIIIHKSFLIQFASYFVNQT
ncbi:MAG: hypothetical protein COB15_10370 [Flavobacteriales bacterium]|nr:MAG: hypothetical protein COB15_10370 [Flavobacteriales bacterium]